MIELRILGTVNLVGPDGTEIRDVITQPKLLALLVYLAVATPCGWHRRDTLLGLLWPEHDRVHARRSLRKALHELRCALGADVLERRGKEDLDLAPNALRCDVVAFEAALKERRFTEAMELYRGDLLPGFFVAKVPEFEHWLEGERARLLEQAAYGAWALAELAIANGSRLDALRWARREAALKPLDEAGTQHLMEVCHRIGNRAAALQAYDEFAERLWTELGVRPCQETRNLRERITISAPIIRTPPDDTATPPVDSAKPRARLTLRRWVSRVWGR
jgi:serine/threonine-protein kinase